MTRHTLRTRLAIALASFTYGEKVEFRDGRVSITFPPDGEYTGPDDAELKACTDVLGRAPDRRDGATLTWDNADPEPEEPPE